MLFDHLEEKEAVKTAALIEENGYRFYTHLADETSDDEARALFRKFAEDELGHLKVLEKKFFPEAGFDDLITDEELALEDYLKRTEAGDIFTERIDIEALVKAVGGPEKAIMVALDTERHSVEYFERLAGKTSVPEARRVYQELMEEEKLHVSQLEELLEKRKGS